MVYVPFRRDPPIYDFQDAFLDTHLECPVHVALLGPLGRKDVITQPFLVNHNTELNALALLEESKKPFPLFHSEVAGLQLVIIAEPRLIPSDVVFDCGVLALQIALCEVPGNNEIAIHKDVVVLFVEGS